jgi:ribosomal protein L11 methyltransferase
MYYTQLVVVCDSAFTDILIAETGEAGFDTFQENENGFEAYCEEVKFQSIILDEIKTKYSFVTPLDFTLDKVVKENWNEEWEKNVEPIIVDGRCLVRAEFHQIEKKYPYEIIVTPKMSFGTGHHQTTHLMLKAQLDIDHENKRVMDAGCGTAILSIMASKRGAKSVEAFDIDEWSVINGQENIANNNCKNIKIQQGKISDFRFEKHFDILLANINKNVLLEEMKIYSSYLEIDGLLLLSGIYEHDIDDLNQCCLEHSLREIKRDEREGWACLLLMKSV